MKKIEHSAIRNITTTDIVKEMGIGINIGNTMESCGDWINGKTVSDFEKAWGSPIITEEMIAGYADAGFRVIRVPVAWSNLMENDYTRTQNEAHLSTEYTINSDLLDRIDTIIEWILDHNMYVILNIHWDMGWWTGFQPTKSQTLQDECMRKYKAVWTQICAKYEKYGDYLMFESLNEELHFQEIWNEWSGTDFQKNVAYNIANSINQAFTDVVRASGGNNAKRHLLIAGYSTDINLTADPLFEMPKDSENRCALSVHYYTPSTFAIIDGGFDAGWGIGRTAWGTDADYAELNEQMNKAKASFIDKGIPVIMGEFGTAAGKKEKGTSEAYTLAVCEAAYIRGICPVLWSTTGGFYNRRTCKMYDPFLESEFKRIAAIDR